MTVFSRFVLANQGSMWVVMQTQIHTSVSFHLCTNANHRHLKAQIPKLRSASGEHYIDLFFGTHSQFFTETTCNPKQDINKH